MFIRVRKLSDLRKPCHSPYHQEESKIIGQGFLSDEIKFVSRHKSYQIIFQMCKKKVKYGNDGYGGAGVGALV